MAVTANFDDARERTREIWLATTEGAAAPERVYRALAEAIAQGLLAGGFRLSEEELASWFDVSRTPIREALVRLEADRLAVRVGRRGLIVSRITRQDILEVYVVREVIDGLSAREAAQAATPVDLFQLNWLAEEVANASARVDDVAMAAKNLAFHEQMAVAAHNALLLDMMRSVHARVRRFPGTTFSFPERAQVAIDEHREIVDAITAGDPARAERAARAHMANAMQVRIAMLDDKD